MCECVSKLNEKLAENDQSLPMAISLDLKGGGSNLEMVIPLTRKNGKPDRRVTGTKFLLPSYCPLCGEKVASP